MPWCVARTSRRDAHLWRLLLFQQRAIAANLLSRYGRVAMLDIDYHHGNGQQEIFYTRSDVLTVSIHGNRASPILISQVSATRRDWTGRRLQSEYSASRAHHAGAASHRGGGGFTPHPPLRSRLPRGVRRLRHGTRRPTGTWPNRARDFEQLGQMIGEQGYSTLVVQEGGYRVRTLGTNVRNFFTGLVTGHSAARIFILQGKNIISRY